MSAIKHLYNKIAPVMAKICGILTVVAAIGLCVSSVLETTLTDPWPHYYAAVAQQAFIWATVACVVLYVVFAWGNVLEFLRRIVVSLKRQPSIIPLLMLAVTFLVYSLNLTDVSDTTAKIQGKGMGLCQFCIMLFSLLSMVCMLNAFPRRKKANIPMLALMFAMFAVIIFCDYNYCRLIDVARFRAESPIVIDKTTLYIAQAYNMLNVHAILMIVTAGLVVLMPVYSKLIRKIKTSVAVEDNGSMEDIEIND